MSEKIKETFLQVVGSVQNVINGPDGNGPTIPIQILIGIILSVIIIFLVNLLRVIIQRIKNNITAAPMIVKNTKDAMVLLRVPQNPNEPESTPLKRSLNEDKGIEFSYMLWMYIGDFNYKLGQWKHVFHKGNDSSWPNRAPGVWIHPNKNALRVYMNTYNNIEEHVDIEDIPLNKWLHLVITVQDNALDIYVNGFLKKRTILSGTCKQNFGDLWVNANGGFHGYISRMQYFDYAVQFSKIEQAMNSGPSMNLPATAVQKPPYFTPYWWIKN
jgi:hypothetical protein